MTVFRIDDKPPDELVSAGCFRIPSGSDKRAGDLLARSGGFTLQGAIDLVAPVVRPNGPPNRTRSRIAQHDGVGAESYGWAGSAREQQ